VRHLIINADGYGFTAGTTRAIEECIEFGTVRSLSANVNFPHADRLVELVQRHPEISVGCHINPIVGRPVLSPKDVPSLVNRDGEFFYQRFMARFLSGQMKAGELYSEMLAQVNKTRDMAGKAFSHVDFHMGLHRLPVLYKIFLDVVEKSGVGRIRTHRYLVGMENGSPRFRHFLFMFQSVTRIPKFLWNLWLRRIALRRGLGMPDRWVNITNMGAQPSSITVKNCLKMLRNLPNGFNEFVAHPGYVDDELRRWSTYLEPRVLERQVLLSAEFRAVLRSSEIRLAGYRDIPLRTPIRR